MYVGLGENKLKVCFLIGVGNLTVGGCSNMDVALCLASFSNMYFLC